MDKKSLLMLVVGIIIGAFLGYFVKTEQGKAPAQKTPTGIMGQNMSKQAPQLTPEQKKQVEEMHKQIKELEAELKNDPNNVQAMESLGNVYYDMKQFDKAIPYYQKVLEKNPEKYSVMVDLASAYWYSGQDDKAINTLKDVLKKDPTFPQALYNLGIIMLHGKNDLNSAKMYWEKLLKSGRGKFDPNILRERIKVIDKLIAQEKSNSRKANKQK